MCRKVSYPTRGQALKVMKNVVWRNAVERHGEKSRGLNVYRCRICLHYHLGHERKQEKEGGA